MTRYRANTPRFVDETVDGEALIMDMVTGSYYTCQDASTIAWHGLTGGLTASDVAAMLSSTYPIETADAERDVERFAAELVQEEMIVVRDGSAESVDAATIGNGTSPGEYQALRFEKYTDLADLILLDPVHDVSDAGWPHEPN
jgi:hypothetical protein